ncbi:MAG: AraC family ligand binding domain-containing protein, partial [Bacteroidota bacterium]
MLLRHQFPDLHWLKRQIKDRFAAQYDDQGNVLPVAGWPTVLLNVSTSETNRPDIDGPLSLFMNVKGWSEVGIAGKTRRLNNETYLLSNRGEAYDLHIHETEPTETYNLHFGDVFCQQAWHSMHHSTEDLLDQPVADDFPDDFPIQILLRNAAIDAAARQFHQLLADPGSESMLQEAALYQLFCLLIGQASREKN